MDESRNAEWAGCAQIVIGAGLILWLGAIPPLNTYLSELLLGDSVAPPAVSAVAVVATALFLLPPFVVAALVTRRRAGWRALAAIAASGTAIAGYVILDATVRALFPASTSPSLHGEGAWAAALRMGLLIPYTVLAAWLAPRLAAAPPRSTLGWLGLNRLKPSTLLLSLAMAALVTVPWPLTGALGDSLTSLSLAFQTLARTIPQVLLFWGLIFCLLTSTFARPWAAALTVILLYGVSTLGGVLPTGDWGALTNGFSLLPAALLLTELRAREGGVYPTLPVLFLYLVMPLLFVDPRDAIAQGIPEPQHILSHTAAMVTAGLLGLALWSGRRLMATIEDRVRVPGGVWLAASGAAALVLWATWGGLYVFAGEPGFANDGFLIILEEQADLSQTATIQDRDARLQQAYDALVETAERTQGPLLDELDALGVPQRRYYIINMIRVDGHRWLMNRFEGRAGVAEVILNPNVRVYPRRIPIPYGGDTNSQTPAKVQPNLAAIQADEAWAMGVTGEGIVVAGQDTGYDWSHPALKPHYRGWDGQTADHDTNWHDAWDHTAVPFDDDSHGTHTMGTVLGDDGGDNHTGVAPGARWIGCRNMQRGFGNPGSYAECMEFFLAPYPHGGDPFTDGDVERAPHLVNNSWGCPDFEGCFPDTLEPAVRALRAAGIMMVVSAGNEGPACTTATTSPANYDASFSVGATTNGGSIVSFSSRGPVDGLIKPDVTAPGSNVRSSVPGGGYGYAGGTSMAGPHVAGVVALLWSANPALSGDIDATEQLICQTATPKPVQNACTTEAPEGQFAALMSNPVCACGDVTGVPNNVYGCGFIDAGAAVQAAMEQ